MTDTKWTPGPWSRQPMWPDRPIPVSGFCISHFSKGDGGCEAEANAHLIAAAPELYEALKNCRDELEFRIRSEFDFIWAESDFERILAPYDVALAKARGDV